MVDTDELARFGRVVALQWPEFPFGRVLLTEATSGYWWASIETDPRLSLAGTKCSISASGTSARAALNALWGWLAGLRGWPE